MMTGNFWNPSDNEFPRTEPPVAIDLAETKQAVVLYPSPAAQALHIDAATPIKTISIYNTVGVSVLTQSTNTPSEIVDVSSLAHGIYFVRIEFADGQVENSQFMKQ
jgi:hypothetical protein